MSDTPAGNGTPSEQPKNILSVHLDLDLDTGALRIHAPADPIRSCGLMELAKAQILYAQLHPEKKDDLVIPVSLMPGALKL